MKKPIIKDVYTKPPFWRILKFFFSLYDTENVSVAFGRSIYSARKIPDDYHVHEKVHLKQHCHSYIIATLWWILYIASKRFRFSQELEAYQKQYKWLCDTKNSIRHARLIRFSKELSSPLYGNLCTEQEAMTKIMNYAQK